MIQTVSGRLIDPLNPDPSQIYIEDVAHALSNQGRFTGHTKSPCWLGRDFYSVAEHSVHVAELLAGEPPIIQLAGLLHDASEAYLSDIASPVKHTPALALYRDAEHRLQEACFMALGCDVCLDHPCVKQADRMMLGIEARDLMGGLRAAHWRDYVSPIATHPLRVRRPWSPRLAREVFLDCYTQLKRKI